MANEVKHLRMTDGTVCDIKNSAYLLKYNVFTTTMNLYQGDGVVSNPSSVDSITDLQTGATITDIPDIETADIFVIIKLYGGDVFTKLYNYSSTYLRAKGCSPVMTTRNIFSYQISINKADLKLTYFRITPTNGADWVSIDRVITVDTNFNVVSDEGAGTAESFFNNGGTPPRVYFKGTNKFCCFRRWYITDMQDNIITDSFYELCQSHGSNVNYQFKLVFEYGLHGYTTDGIKLTQTITNSNDGNMRYTSFTAVYIN